MRNLITPQNCQGCTCSHLSLRGRNMSAHAVQNGLSSSQFNHSDPYLRPNQCKILEYSNRSWMDSSSQYFATGSIRGWWSYKHHADAGSTEYYSVLSLQMSGLQPHGVDDKDED